MTEELSVFVEGQMMGCLLWDRRRDRLSFRYDTSWADFPLSLSMPLAASEHGHSVVEAFLWGLLPDNDGVLQRWGERFQVSPRNAFKLLWHVGEECAGAVQFIRPDRLATWSKNPPPGGVTWLTLGEVAGRIQLLLKDHSASRTSSDAGSFSLAGAQPKTAFIFDPKKKRWGIPFGSVPTTHILKPATGAFDGFAENEHFCLRLAGELGFPTASSSVQYFGDCPVITVERYDRIRHKDGVIRVHQEDLCQALACMPQSKYQNQGGPSPAQILDVIRRYSTSRSKDEERFVDSLVLSWLTGGTDAHAKNFSILIAAGGRVRLAPLYDLSSALPYPKQVDLRRATLAVKIGGTYKLREIGLRQWEKFAAEHRLDAGALAGRIRTLSERMPEAASTVARTLAEEGITHPVIKRLVDEITLRSLDCGRKFQV